MQVTLLAGSPIGVPGFQNGIGTNAFFNLPTGVCISLNQTFILIADRSNSQIRQLIPIASPTSVPSVCQQLCHLEFPPWLLL